MALEWLNFAGNQEVWREGVSHLFYILGWVFWILIFIAVILFFVYLAAFNLKVSIYDTVGDHNMLRFVRKAKARIVKKHNVEKLQIFMVRDLQEPPSSDYYMLCAKGKMLNLLRDGFNYKPFKMTNNPGTISVHDHDIRFWLSQTVGTIVKKYTEQSFFQKYGTYIVFIFGLLVLGWMYYVLMQNISTHVNEELTILRKVSEMTAERLSAP